MRIATTASVVFVVLAGCAAHRNSVSPAALQENSSGLFVGHSEDGQVVVAATHYDAMNGLAVVESDIGVAGRKDTDGALVCRREMPTGTHFPHWACRYVSDLAHERQLVLNSLQQPAFSPNMTQRGGIALGVGSGSQSKTQPQ